MFKLYFLLAAAALAVTGTSLAPECCPTKVVAGTDEDPLAGTYKLYNGPANFLDVCRDKCAYKKEGGNTEDTYCFRTEGATHSTECVATGTTPPGSGGTTTTTTMTTTTTTTTTTTGGGPCPYPKENLSQGEYQVTIPIPSKWHGKTPIITISFDAETEIGSCNNCEGLTCGNDYHGPFCFMNILKSNDPLILFNIKKVGSTGENDRSNMLSVMIVHEEMCSV